MRTIIASIFGKEDEEQKVLVEFEHIVRGGFLERSAIEVTYCNVVNMLTIKPSDLNIDLECAIGEELGYLPHRVQIKCDVDLPNVKTEKKLQLEKLFV